MAAGRPGVESRLDPPGHDDYRAWPGRSRTLTPTTAKDKELLAIFDSLGKRLGSKPRARVHRDGDWHLVVFVLAAWRDASRAARILLQLRAAPGDPYRGHVDVLAAGHVLAGESERDAARRELREETGLELSADELADLGGRCLENPTGVCRRVIQRFYLCPRPIRLEEVRLSAEVGGFLEAELGDFAELIDGKRALIRARARVPPESARTREIDVTPEYLAAYSPQIIDSFRRSILASRRFLDTGHPDPAVWEA